MSFISIVTTGKFTSMVTDGRTRNAVTNEIVEENFKKMVKIGSCLVGVVGNPGFLDLIVTNMKKLNIPATIDNLNQVISLLLQTNIQQENGERAYAHIVLTGTNEENDFVAKAYTNVPDTDYSHLDYVVKRNSEEVRFITLPPSDCAIDSNHEFMEIWDGKTSLSSIITKQRKLNGVIADNCYSVNKITFNDSIR